MYFIKPQNKAHCGVQDFTAMNSFANTAWNLVGWVLANPTVF